MDYPTMSPSLLVTLGSQFTNAALIFDQVRNAGLGEPQPRLLCGSFHCAWLGITPEFESKADIPIAPSHTLD